MIKISSDTIYETSELKRMLRNKVSLQLLKIEGGLKPLPGGGWYGKRILDALDKITDNSFHQSGASPRNGKEEKKYGETHQTRSNTESRETVRVTRQPVEPEVERFHRLTQSEI